VAAARDARGRFPKGVSGNPGGRPKVTTSERYLRKMARTVKMADWERIIETGIARAKAGDLGWARWLGEYLIGKPTQRIETDVTTGGESLNEGARLTNARRAALIVALLERGDNEAT
jgi:alpha-D-ribose 1-methylphosphonate 5-triphosphate synthase subunit PhnG